MAHVVNGIIAFVFLALVARLLGPDLLGKYILVVAYVRVAILLVNSGINPIAFRELARERDAPIMLFNDILSLRFTLCVAGYLGLIGVLLALADDREMLRLVALEGMLLFIIPFKESFAAYYTAQERLAIPSMFDVAVTALTSLAGIGLLLAGHGILALIASGVAIMAGGTLGWGVFFRRRELHFGASFRPAQWRRLLLLVLPFAPIHAANQLNRVINVILLGRIPGPIPTDRAVGLYAPAQQITNSVVMMALGLRRVMIPPITRRLSAGYTLTHEIDLAIKLVVALFALPLLLCTSFMAHEIVTLLFGERFAPSAVALQVLGASGALQLAALVPESFLFSHPRHQLRDYIPGSILSVLCNLVLCAAFIGEYGILGAAAAAVAARALYFLFAVHYCRRAFVGQTLRLGGYADLAVLVATSFAVWHAVFAWLTQPWVAFVVASLVTLPLLVTFLLVLRARAMRRTAT